MKKLKLLSLFSGIGAFEKALTNLGVDYELVAYSEKDKYASKSYCAIHNVDEAMNLGDITQIDEKKLPKDIDLTVYGFPCTDISLAGRQVGLFNEDGTRTRSGLFFDALRIIKETQPKVAIAENVKNLTGKKFKLQFELVLKSLEDAGYNNYWKVLNSKDFGIPQNRERVFIISVRKDVDNGQYEFPQGFPLKLRLKDMLDDIVDEKYYIKYEKAKDLLSKIDVEEGSLIGGLQKHQSVKNDGISTTLTSAMGMGGGHIPMVVEPIRLGNIYGEHFGTGYAGNVWDKNAISPTLMTMQGGNRQPMVIVEETTENENMEEVENKTSKIGFEDVKLLGAYGRNYGSRGKLQDVDGICDTLVAAMGTGGGNVPIITEPVIQKIDIPQTVKIRKYDVDCKLLCNCLRNHKENLKLSNKEISNVLNIPLTKVEHYFRQDDYFAIPDSEIWLKLKELLKIETDEFDKAIMTFEEKEGVYEKSERHYFADGIAPTLTSSSAGNEKFIVEENITINEPSVLNPLKNKSPYGWHFEQNVYDTNGITRAIKAGGGSGNIPKAIIYDEPKINVIGNYSPSNHDASRIVDENGIAPTVKENHGTVTATVHNFKIRKLTPKECFRLQGFDDRSFELAEKVNSNSQLYKQAGNSITVQVLEYVIKALFDCNLLN